METHHVNPRRACPALFGLLTPSPGERSAQLTLAQAERTCSNSAHAFTQANDLTWNPAKHDWIGKVHVSNTSIPAQVGGNGNASRMFVTRQGYPAFLPCPTARGLS